MAKIIITKFELSARTSLTGNEYQRFYKWVKFVPRTSLWNIVISRTYMVQYSDAHCTANIMHINAQYILTFW